MKKRIDEICAEPAMLSGGLPSGLAAGIFPASVYRCEDPDQAERRLGGDDKGYVYQRDAHPNADLLAEKCRHLHDADWALITSSGMAALSLATLTLLQCGDHVLVSQRLYGRTTQQLVEQWGRLGVESTVVNTLSTTTVRESLQSNTKLVVVETLTNPMLRVAPLSELAALTRSVGAKLLVDNTFATPVVCRPFEIGADYVMESISKMINGHSDVMLGVLAGRGDESGAFRDVSSVWGLASSPFDCWLAYRGAQTLHLRMERACDNALSLARELQSHSNVVSVVYPGLDAHPDHSIAQRQFTDGRYGTILTFDVSGGRPGAAAVIAALTEIPFCPSLGEVSSTISHPASTSHRRMSAEGRNQLGIGEGTLRLSVGTESKAWLADCLNNALRQSDLGG